MADEYQPPQNQPQSQEYKPSRPPSTDFNCHPSEPTQFQLAVDKFKADLEVKYTAAKVDYENKKTQANTKSETACIVREQEKWIRGTVKQYSFMNNCIVMYASKDIEGLKGIVEEDKKQAEAMLKSFSESVNLIKSSKSQTAKVYALAKKLQDALPDSCNSEEIKLISACFGNYNVLKEKVNEITRYANHVNNQIDDISESAVKAAAIISYVNMTTVENFTAEVKKSGDAFTTNIKDNVTSLQKDSDAFLKDMAKSQEEYSTSVQDKYKSRNTEDAWQATRSFDPQKPQAIDEFTKLLSQVEASFDEAPASESDEIASK